MSLLIFGSSPHLRLEALGGLNRLEVLKIRSVSGTFLDDGLSTFSQLKELKALVSDLILDSHD